MQTLFTQRDERHALIFVSLIENSYFDDFDDVIIFFLITSKKLQQNNTIINKNENKRCVFPASSPDDVIINGHPIFLSWWIPATPASTTQNIGCPSIMTPSKIGKTKKSHLLFSNS